MHPEIKQLFIDITVFLSVVFVPLLMLIGAYFGVQTLLSLAGKRPSMADRPDGAELEA